jgi:hypothetical protein
VINPRRTLEDVEATWKLNGKRKSRKIVLFCYAYVATLTLFWEILYCNPYLLVSVPDLH